MNVSMDEDEKPVVTLFHDFASAIKFTSLFIGAILGAASILYSLGLAPLSSAQFEKQLMEAHVKNEKADADLEKRLIDRMDQRFAPAPRHIEATQEEVLIENRLGEIEKRISDLTKTHEQIVKNDYESALIVSKIEERTVNLMNMIKEIRDDVSRHVKK